MSADLFGYTTLLQDDLGIGQNIDDAMPYFDFCANGFIRRITIKFNGHTNPAEFPMT